jgi:hypothetical protein
MTHEPGPNETRLDALTGSWRTEGRTKEGPDATAAAIHAVDTYEWLPGRFAILHTVDARVGDEHVEGAEIIGWDPDRNAYVTQYFGTDGPNAYEASLADEDGVLVWSMRSQADRFTGRFSADGKTITGHWEQLDDQQRWQPWMEVTLTKDTS